MKTIEKGIRANTKMKTIGQAAGVGGLGPSSSGSYLTGATASRDYSNLPTSILPGSTGNRTPDGLLVLRKFFDAEQVDPVMPYIIGGGRMDPFFTGLTNPYSSPTPPDKPESPDKPSNDGASSGSATEEEEEEEEIEDEDEKKKKVKKSLKDEIKRSPKKAKNKAIDDSGQVTVDKLEPKVKEEYNKKLEELKTQLQNNPIAKEALGINDINELDKKINPKKLIENFNNYFKEKEDEDLRLRDHLQEQIIDKHIKPIDNLLTGSQNSVLLARDKSKEFTEAGEAEMRTLNVEEINNRLNSISSNLENNSFDYDEEGLRTFLASKASSLPAEKRDKYLSDVENYLSNLRTTRNLNSIAYASTDSNGDIEFDNTILNQTVSDFVEEAHHNEQLQEFLDATKLMNHDEEYSQELLQIGFGDIEEDFT
jgi:hypothetical protein